MAKTLSFEFEGTNYTLEFTRNSIKQMEKQGFNVTEIEAHPMTVITDLFAGAFIAHHRGISPMKVNEIYEAIEDKEGLLAALSEMYAEPIQALMDDSQGNIQWAKNW